MNTAEERIHDQIIALAQRIFDETGIRIDDLRVNWRDISSLSKLSQQVVSINLATTAAKTHG